jgi:hypothetical protein
MDENPYKSPTEGKTTHPIKRGKRGLVYFFAALAIGVAAEVGFVVHGSLSFGFGRPYETTMLASYVGAVIGGVSAAIAAVAVSLLLKKREADVAMWAKFVDQARQARTNRNMRFKRIQIILAAIAIVIAAVFMTFSHVDMMFFMPSPNQAAEWQEDDQ